MDRRSLDKFYTKDHVALDCIHQMLNVIHPSLDDLFVEPSAGNGSFVKGLEQLEQKLDAIDLYPEDITIRQQNFYTYHPPHTKGLIHVIGNPPFGRQSSEAFRFIKKAAEFAYSISFILPKSFKKESTQKRIPSYFHLVHESDLPNSSFLLDDIDYEVPCVFQIWRKEDYPRKVIEPVTSPDFEFVKKNQQPHASIRRVGMNTGEVSTDLRNKNIQTHYFIKFTDEGRLDGYLSRLRSLTYPSKDYTVGPRSIGRTEIIKEWNKS